MKSLDCPVFISEATEDSYYNTRKGIQDGSSESAKRRGVLKGKTVAIESSATFRIGDIDFEPFSVPHDAADNFGFVAMRDGVRVATLMDFGYMSALISIRFMAQRPSQSSPCAAAQVGSTTSRLS